MISAGKEADVYLCRYRSAPLAVKVYRLYRTSHRGGRPIKLEAAGCLAAHEWDMLLQAWRGGATVPTPARRVENMLSMRFLGNGDDPAPRLQDAMMHDPSSMMRLTLEGVEQLARSGVVHSDLSAYNILVQDDRPWFIDLSEGIRVDRVGYSAWQRWGRAEGAVKAGLIALHSFFRKRGCEFNIDETAALVMEQARRQREENINH